MATQWSDFNVPPPYHVNGSVTTGPNAVNLTRGLDGKTWADSLYINNLPSGGILQVSFDGGTNYFSMATPSTFTITNVRLFQCHVKSPGTANYEMVLTSNRIKGLGI